MIKYVVANDNSSAGKELTLKYGAEIADYAPTQQNYNFDGWYTDDTYTTEWTKPDTMPDSDITVYGKFVRQTAKLIISKSGMESGENAIFTVTGEGLGNGLKVVVPNGGSVTIDGLLVGANYTITEDSGWTYRYTTSGDPTSVSVTKEGKTYTAAFTNVTQNEPWLNGETRSKNVFNKATPVSGN